MGIQFHVLPVTDDYVVGFAEIDPKLAKRLGTTPESERARSRQVTFADFQKAATAVADRIPKLTCTINKKGRQITLERGSEYTLINASPGGGHYIQGWSEEILVALGETLAISAGPQVVANDGDDPDLVWLCLATA